MRACASLGRGGSFLRTSRDSIKEPRQILLSRATRSSLMMRSKVVVGDHALVRRRSFAVEVREYEEALEALDVVLERGNHLPRMPELVRRASLAALGAPHGFAGAVEEIGDAAEGELLELLAVPVEV